MHNQLNNFQLSDDEIEARLVEAKSTCLVDGDNSFGFYFINTGNVAVQSIFTLSEAGDANDEDLSQLISKSEIEQIGTARALFDEQKLEKTE